MLTDSCPFSPPPFTYLPTIILLFRGGQLFWAFYQHYDYDYSHSYYSCRPRGGARFSVRISSPTVPLLGGRPVAWGGEFAGGSPPFSATHFLGVWTYCRKSAISSTESPVLAPQHLDTSRTSGWRSERGLIIKRPSFSPAVITQAGFDLLLAREMKGGKDEDCFTVFRWYEGESFTTQHLVSICCMSDIVKLWQLKT